MFHMAPLGGRAVPLNGLCQRTKLLSTPLVASGSRRFSSQISATSGSVSRASSGDAKLYAPFILKEVVPPRGGSPVYWSLRRWIFRAKREMLLIPRQFRWNTCLIRASFGGVPKQSYDPKINQWVKIMDNEEWGGVGGRLWINISNNLMFNVFLAFVLYAGYFRLIANNKHNVFAKWATSDEDDD